MNRKLSKHHFWRWFLRHHHEYLHLQKKTNKEAKYWIDEMNTHLRAYFKYLGFAITWKKDGQNAVLTISAHGKARYFDRVDAFVATAPEIPGWQVQALEEPMPLAFMLRGTTDEAGIDPQEFRCALSGDTHRPVLTLYHPLYTEERRNAFRQMADMVVYALLGERSFGQDIAAVYVDNLSRSAGDEELIVPDDLPAYVGSRESHMVVDASGRISGRDE